MPFVTKLGNYFVLHSTVNYSNLIWISNFVTE